MSTIEKTAPNCELVPREYGNPVDFELMRSMPEVAIQIASNQIEAQPPAYSEDSQKLYKEIHPDFLEIVQRGEKTKTLVKGLGCEACSFNSDCLVFGTFQDVVEASETAKARGRILQMLQNSPNWLTQSRVEISEATILDEDGNLRDTTELAQLLGKAENQPLPSVVQGQLDELKTVEHINPEKPIPGFRITKRPDPAAGESLAESEGVDVYDASEHIDGFNGTPLTPEAYKILSQKLLNLIVNEDKGGQLQILSPNGTMQKVLRGWKGEGKACELRMEGKNRLYFTLQTDGVTRPRIVILGGHGGDEGDQIKFLANIGI